MRDGNFLRIAHTNTKRMPLSNEQIRKIVKSPKKQDELTKARNHEQRLRFHSETILQKRDLGAAYQDFLKWIGSENPILLESGKVQRIDQLIRTPIPTVELSESMYSRLHRVFFSQDAFFAYDFKDEKLLKDWEEFSDSDFWATKGFEAMKLAINSVWVLGLPTEQKGDIPEPFNKLVNIDNVIDISVDSNNNCRWVIFYEGQYLFVYDDEAIRVFNFKDGKLGAEEMTIEHELEYTPARMMWTDKLEMEDYINKQSPITKELADLDWLLFHLASKRYLDISNAYPILVSYDVEGGYNDDSQTDNKSLISGKYAQPEAGSMIGAGTHIKVDPPEDGQPDMMSNPMEYINPDVTTLDWHVKEEIRLAYKIFRSVVGTDLEVRNDQAKNEMQVEGAFESQKSVLLRVKANFEAINKFADETICRVRYGDGFIGCTIDYGTKFFLKSVEGLYQDYKSAKDSGANEVVLDEITTTILNTSFRDDQTGRTRAEIIRDLDPLPEKNLEEAIKILEKGGISKERFAIKANLLSYVKRFERENGSLVQFSKARSYDKKLEEIINKFKDYSNENGLSTEGE